MKRALLSVLSLALAIATSAQTTRVRGAVRDEETGEPIPFASVYFDGTVIGISTDLEGRYSLETRSEEITTLTAHLIGYEAETKQIAKGAFSEVDFLLKKDMRQLEAALVRPDNRYIRSTGSWTRPGSGMTRNCPTPGRRACTARSSWTLPRRKTSLRSPS